MGNTPSTPEEMLDDKIEYVFEHFGCSRDAPPDVKKSAATWNALGWKVFLHNAGMAEDYALSPHALAAAYLSLSAAVTSATAAEDGKVHLTTAGRELCVGVQLPIIFEEGVMPLVKHVADVAASVQKTHVTMPAPTFEARPSMWMPFPSTREYVEFLQDQLGTYTFKLKDEHTFFQWLDSEVTGCSMGLRQRGVKLDRGAALHASTFSVGRRGGAVFAAQVDPVKDVYRDFFNCGGGGGGGSATSPYDYLLSSSSHEYLPSSSSYGQTAAAVQSAAAAARGGGGAGAAGFMGGGVSGGSVGIGGGGGIHGVGIRGGGKMPCKYMRINHRRTRVAEVVVNPVNGIGGGTSGAATGIVADPRLASFCGSGTFATVIELPYVSPGGGGNAGSAGTGDTNLTAVFILPAVNISLGAVLNALKTEPLRWGHWCAGLRAGGAKQYEVHVPMFALTQQAHGLRAALTEVVGVREIFERPSEAKVNTLVRMTSTSGACVSEVVQASYLECSAAAAPADPNAPPKPRSELVRPLVINRPFLYVMVHAPTGSIMHVAKVSRPGFLGVGGGGGGGVGGTR